MTALLPIRNLTDTRHLQWLVAVTTLVLVALLEAVTEECDNLILSLYSVILYLSLSSLLLS